MCIVLPYGARMTETRDPEAVVRDCFAWSNGEFSKVDVMAESLDVYNPGLPDGESHERSVWAEYTRAIHDGFPDIHFEILELASSENTVLVEYRVSGTHRGAFDGLPPTHREIEFRATDTFHVADGQVTEWRSYYDTAELQAQLGMTFPTVIGQLPRLVVGKLRSMT